MDGGRREIERKDGKFEQPWDGGEREFERERAEYKDWMDGMRGMR